MNGVLIRRGHKDTDTQREAHVKTQCVQNSEKIKFFV
jgi:hypothetical protein